MSYSLAGGIAGAIAAWIFSPRNTEDDSFNPWVSRIKSFFIHVCFVGGGAFIGMKIGMEKLANGTYHAIPCYAFSDNSLERISD